MVAGSSGPADVSPSAGLGLVASLALTQALKLTLLSYALAWLLASEPRYGARCMPRGARGVLTRA
jgi:hypothetical protein